MDKAVTNSSVIWPMGLSGSGKSTIAQALEKIISKSYTVKTFDGDCVRTGLNKDLGFSESDRAENLRRVAEVAKLFGQAGLLTICSFITPLESHRKIIKSILADGLSIIYIDTPLEECEARDPKGLYKKARPGEIRKPSSTSLSFFKK
jgi:adenylyl-sulfate kinase